MKRAIFSLSVITALFASSNVLAATYNAKCIYADTQEEKTSFPSCSVNISNSSVGISFGNEKYQSANQTLSGKNVTGIASGEYATKLMSSRASFVSGLFLGPVNSLTKLFLPDRNYQQYIVKYKNSQNQETATIIRVSQADAPQFQQDLTIATGRLVVFEEAQTRTTINVVPQLKF